MKHVRIKFQIGQQCLDELTKRINAGAEVTKIVNRALESRVVTGVTHCPTCMSKRRAIPCRTKQFDANWQELPVFFVCEKGNAEQLAVDLSEELFAFLKSYAKRFEKTAAAVARDALERYLLHGEKHCDGCTCKAKQTGTDEKGAAK